MVPIFKLAPATAPWAAEYDKNFTTREDAEAAIPVLRASCGEFDHEWVVVELIAEVLLEPYCLVGE